MTREQLSELCSQEGGVYRTTVLIEKRLKELKRGARPLVADTSGSLTDVVFREIREGKISLVPDTEENRTKAREAVENLSVQVDDSMGQDELERRIRDALSGDL